MEKHWFFTFIIFFPLPLSQRGTLQCSGSVTASVRRDRDENPQAQGGDRGLHGKGSDTTAVQELPAPWDCQDCPQRSHRTVLGRVASFAVRAGEARLAPGSVNCNIRGFTVSLHLGYFLAVASFMALINLGKRICCQNQQPPRAFPTLTSSRATEREVLFACIVDARLFLSFQRSIWIFPLNTIFLFVSILKSSEEFVLNIVLAHTPPYIHFPVCPVLLSQ